MNAGDPGYQDKDFCIDATNMPLTENGLYLVNHSYEKCKVTNCWACTTADTCDECRDPSDSSIQLYPVRNVENEKDTCNTCLEEDGFYFDSDSKCQRCFSECQTCSSFPDCLTCPDGTFLQPTTPTCGPECPSLFYKDSTQNKCLPCDSSCKTN